MNPMTNVKNVQKLNERELKRGAPSSTSWHRQYRDSAWLFIGGLPYDLTEGDVIVVFSQYGEIVNLNLVRDKATGKSKGFCFLCYEDQRSTVLAVDNLNSIKLMGRTLRVDHCENYKQPKDTGEEDEITKKLRTHGCAPTSGVDQIDNGVDDKQKDGNKSSKRKKEKKKKKHKKKRKEESDSGSDESDDEKTGIKEERVDRGYDKYRHSGETRHRSRQHSDSEKYSERKKVKTEQHKSKSGSDKRKHSSKDKRHR